MLMLFTAKQKEKFLFTAKLSFKLSQKVMIKIKTLLYFCIGSVCGGTLLLLQWGGYGAGEATVENCFFQASCKLIHGNSSLGKYNFYLFFISPRTILLEFLFTFLNYDFVHTLNYVLSPFFSFFLRVLCLSNVVEISSTHNHHQHVSLLSEEKKICLLNENLKLVNV